MVFNFIIIFFNPLIRLITAVHKIDNLQVSKTQKFGYGYMVSQIVGIPAGLQALERCGFIR